MRDEGNSLFLKMLDLVRSIDNFYTLLNDPVYILNSVLVSPGYWQLIQQYYLNSHNRHQHSVFHFYCHMIQWEETEANRNVVSKLLTGTVQINQCIRFMILISLIN